MDIALHEFGNLTEDDVAFLSRLDEGLQFLADISQADAYLCCLRSGGQAEIVAQARPHSILPIYTELLAGKALVPADEPAIFQALTEGRYGSGERVVAGQSIRVYQQVHPVRAPDGRVVAAASIETSLFERERQRRRGRVYQQALRQVQEMVLRGELRGIERLTPIGEHEGMLVIDAQHRIRYVSGIAANLYRKMGYGGSLLERCIEELDIDDNSHVVEVMEKGECVEKEVRTQDHAWVKKAIPLIATRRPWLRWLPSQNGHRFLEGALLLVSDVTDLRRQEEELQIKVTMIREIHHRVKNNLQTIASLLRMQARRSELEPVRRALNEGISRILSVAVIHEFLAHQDAKVINIRDVGQRIVGQIRESVLDREKRIRLELRGPNIPLPTQQATACALVINELVQNALEHGFENRIDGTVVVNLQDDGQTVTIHVKDDGRGLPEAFDVTQTNSLGLRIVQSLVQSDLKGSFELNSRDNGVSATVTFPKQAQGG